MKDIAPDLLKAIQDDFNERVKTNAKVRNALRALQRLSETHLQNLLKIILSLNCYQTKECIII